MSTPLTDAITALTTYANEITGGSDTTLSAAVGTLAAGYGPAYLPYDLRLRPRMSVSNSTASVVFDGEEFTVTFLATPTTSNIVILDVTDFALTTTTKELAVSKWFTIPVGHCVLTIYDVVNDSGVDFATNFKQADSTTSLHFGSGNGTHTDGSIVTVDNLSSVDVGCFFVFINSAQAGNMLKFKMSFTVDGTRYF